MAIFGRQNDASAVAAADVVGFSGKSIPTHFGTACIVYETHHNTSTNGQGNWQLLRERERQGRSFQPSNVWDSFERIFVLCANGFMKYAKTAGSAFQAANIT